MFSHILKRQCVQIYSIILILKKILSLKVTKYNKCIPSWIKQKDKSNFGSIGSILFFE